MQQKYELGTRLSYFWQKNEKKISLNSIYIRAPTFSTQMPCPFKICFTNKVNAVFVGGQLLVTGSQGPITRVSGVRIPCPRVASPKVHGPKSQSHRVPGLRVSGLRVPGLKLPGSWVARFQGPGSQFSGSWVPGLRSWF